MATTHVAARGERVLPQPLVVEQEIGEPWVVSVVEGSQLPFARKSLLHQRTQRSKGRWVLDASHILPVIQSLRVKGILPDALLPAGMFEGVPHMTEIGWTEETDPALNFYEEAGDLAIQLLKCTIGDRETVRRLTEAEVRRDYDAQRAIIAERLTQRESEWVWSLYLTDDKVEGVEILTNLFVGLMASRRTRGVSVIQTRFHILRKLLSGSDENLDEIRPELERLGEYAELKQAARIINERKLSAFVGGIDVEAEVITLGTHIDEVKVVADTSDERTFLDKFNNVIDQFQWIMRRVGFDLEQVVNFGIAKQMLRLEIGQKIQAMMRDNHLEIADPRAVPKVIAQLTVPLLLWKYGARIGE